MIPSQQYDLELLELTSLILVSVLSLPDKALPLGEWNLQRDRQQIQEESCCWRPSCLSAIQRAGDLGSAHARLLIGDLEITQEFRLVDSIGLSIKSLSSSGSLIFFPSLQKTS